MANLGDLLSIKELSLPTSADALDWNNSVHGRPSFGGVYVFWWRDSPENFLRSMQNRLLHFHGPKGITLTWEIKLSSLKAASNGLLPLYVGKNASDIGRRVGLHLKLKTKRTVPTAAVNGVCARMTTSCQIRDRFDRLFPKTRDTRGLALEKLALSYVRLDGKESFVERFFLEDRAIGKFRPIFNVDSER